MPGSQISVNSVCLTSLDHVGLHVFSLGNMGEKGAKAHNVPAANRESPRASGNRKHK